MTAFLVLTPAADDGVDRMLVNVNAIRRALPTNSNGTEIDLGAGLIRVKESLDEIINRLTEVADVTDPVTGG